MGKCRWRRLCGSRETVIAESSGENFSPLLFSSRSKIAKSRFVSINKRCAYAGGCFAFFLIPINCANSAEKRIIKQE